MKTEKGKTGKRPKPRRIDTTEFKKVYQAKGPTATAKHFGISIKVTLTKAKNLGIRDRDITKAVKQGVQVQIRRLVWHEASNLWPRFVNYPEEVAAVLADMRSVMDWLKSEISEINSMESDARREERMYSWWRRLNELQTQYLSALQMSMAVTKEWDVIRDLMIMRDAIKEAIANELPEVKARVNARIGAVAYGVQKRIEPGEPVNVGSDAAGPASDAEQQQRGVLEGSGVLEGRTASDDSGVH